MAAPHTILHPAARAPRRSSLALERPDEARTAEFLRAVACSRALHGRWIEPPDSRAAYRAYLARIRDGSCEGHFVIDADDALVGVVNIGEIVLGGLRSGHFSYYAFAPHAGRGLMGQAARRVVSLAFRDYGLHRLEANIQPDNTASRALALKLGFRCEGFSPRYLKIAGRWRDHERWAITAETWRQRRGH